MDGQWYSYDDSSVDLVPEEEVCTRGAYILFYQRRNTIPPWSASSSLRGNSIISCVQSHFKCFIYKLLFYKLNGQVRPVQRMAHWETNRLESTITSRKLHCTGGYNEGSVQQHMHRLLSGHYLYK